MHSQDPTNPTDHYQLLGISFNASEDEIRRAYRHMAMQWHPDRNDDPAAEEMMKKINGAWEILGDPESKAEYDLLLRAISQDHLDTQLRTAIRENLSLQEISTIINRGAYINARDNNDLMPLHAAAEHNENPAVIDVLVSRGAYLFEPDYNGLGLTPLDYAARYNENPEVFRLLRSRSASATRSATTTSSSNHSCALSMLWSFFRQ